MKINSLQVVRQLCGLAKLISTTEGCSDQETDYQSVSVNLIWKTRWAPGLKARPRREAVLPEDEYRYALSAVEADCRRGLSDTPAPYRPSFLALANARSPSRNPANM